MDQEDPAQMKWPRLITGAIFIVITIRETYSFAEARGFPPWRQRS